MTTALQMAEKDGKYHGALEDSTAALCPSSHHEGGLRDIWLLGLSNGRIATARPRAALPCVHLVERRKLIEELGVRRNSW